jgi:acid phosphatase (class A)
MHKLSIALAAALALAACATATPAPAPAPVAAPAPSTEPVHPTTPERNPAVQIDPSVFLPPPPAADSALELAERTIVRGTWTEARRQQAVEDNQIDPFAAFDSVLGPNFTGANFPATFAVLDRAGRAAGFAGDPLKFVHRRPRPFVADDSIVTCIPRPTSYSYPSGHAALGFAWSLVLAELVPSRADAIIERGRDFSWSRVVCGMHYPSDVEAGRTVAAAAIARIHADADFRRDLDAARAELAAAYGP